LGQLFTTTVWGGETTSSLVSVVVPAIFLLFVDNVWDLGISFRHQFMLNEVLLTP
jgi:hypothetical protein